MIVVPLQDGETHHTHLAYAALTNLIVKSGPNRTTPTELGEFAIGAMHFISYVIGTLKLPLDEVDITDPVCCSKAVYDSSGEVYQDLKAVMLSHLGESESA